AKAELESMVSREAAFLYNNLLLVGIAFTVFWGTIFPILSEWAKGTKITVGPPFFNAVNVPLGLLLLALTGVGPLIAWRKASVGNLKRQFLWPTTFGLAIAIALLITGMRRLAPLMTYGLCGFVAGTIVQEFYKGIRARQAIHNESVVAGFLHLVGRNRRRYGGYIVHAGIVMLFAAFAGMAFATQHDVTLSTGQSFEARDPYGHAWRFVSQGVSTSVPRDREVQGVGLEMFRDGKRLGIITSEKRQYLDMQGNPLFSPITKVGIRTTPQLDTYVVLTGLRSADTAELRISFNPLVVWVWLGGFLMMIGGLIVMWPQAEKRRAQAGYAAVMPTHAESSELAGAV
ncbi:MAG: cytochrome c-type biogenesis CcmF C-terminal domain-containing protein, partial [Gemmatimonadaceae bacterium]